MIKRIMIGLLALGSLIALAGGAYYLWLTAPIQVSGGPPAAPTLVASPRPASDTPSADLLRLYRIDPDQSEALYRVDETFFDTRGLVTVTGTTRAIAGEVLIDPVNLAASQVGEIVVDISQLATDEPNRDNAIRRAWLESAQYPIATFSNGSIEDAPKSAPRGSPFRFKLTGDLRIKQETRRVTWEVEALLSEEILRVSATLPIKMSQFGVEPPSLAMLRVEDDVLLALRLVAVAVRPEELTPTPLSSAQGCIPTGYGPTRTEPIDEAPVRDTIGEGYVLRGAVRSSLGCKPLTEAKIIFWLAGPDGQYDDAHRATVFTGKDGQYTLKTSYPGLYGGRTVPHIHLFVTADSHRDIELEYQLRPGETEGVYDVVLEFAGVSP